MNYLKKKKIVAQVTTPPNIQHGSAFETYKHSKIYVFIDNNKKKNRVMLVISIIFISK